MSKRFNVSSGQIRIGDPCYKEIEFSPIYKASNGVWEVQIFQQREGRNTRVLGISALCKSKTKVFKTKVIELGVDSGQMAIGDVTNFLPENEDWYDTLCDLSLSEENCGIFLNSGIVTESGWGDGTYPVTLLIGENDEVVGVDIDFQGEDDLYDDEYDYEGDDEDEDND